MFPLIFGIISAGLTLAGSLMRGASEAQNARNNAAIYEAQANAHRAQAQREIEKGELEAWKTSGEKRRLTREYRQREARNLVNLASGNVDPFSGSALDVSLGNANNYALDIGDNAYKRALNLYEASESANAERYSANVADAQASQLRRTAANMGSLNLLTAPLEALTAGFGAYNMAGGVMNFFSDTGKVAAEESLAASLAEENHRTVYRW